MPAESFFIGIVISCLFVELCGFYPGGIIVPAYLGLYLDQPLRVVGTLLAAGLTWGICRLLNQWFIIYGRRRFVLMIVLGGMMVLVGYRWLPQLWPTAVELRPIGWLIPGIFANTLERQGLWLTFIGLTITSIIIFFVIKLLLMVGAFS